jgi:hypothetical protein
MVFAESIMTSVAFLMRIDDIRQFSHAKAQRRKEDFKKPLRLCAFAREIIS